VQGLVCDPWEGSEQVDGVAASEDGEHPADTGSIGADPNPITRACRGAAYVVIGRFSENAIRAKTTAKKTSGSGPHRRQKSPAAHGVAIDPTHRYLPVADFSADRIFVEIREEPPPPRVRFSNAAASLQCTPSDYTRFLALLCERSHRATWEIPEATRREMVSPQVAVQEHAPFWWGLGVAVERDADGWRIGHEGNNDNRFTSYSGANPTRQYTPVIMTNGFGFEVYQRIVRSTTGLDQLSFVTNYQPPRAV
jgi:hypothetical protein